MSKQVALSKSFDVKQIGNESKHIGAASLGFFGSNALFNKVVPEKMRTGLNAVLVTLAMLFVGAYVATKTNNSTYKSIAYGAGVYSFTKMLNSATSITPAVNGLGFAIPDGIRNAINQIVPNLGESGDQIVYDVSGMQIMAPGTQIAAVDAQYEILNASEDLIAGPGEDLNLPDLSGKNPQRVQRAARKPLCTVNGVDELTVA